MLKASVIIPTYNRSQIVKKCLNALLEQTFSYKDFEILVIDDGSTDATKDIVIKTQSSSRVSIEYFFQENKGPAAARNLGIKNAKGEILILIDDDIIATAKLLDEHINWHHQFKENNIATLGYVTWFPEFKITRFMYWLEHGGPQFTYGDLEGKTEIDFNYFYTANISLKKKFLLENGLFDEDFPYPAYEDLELAYRLKRKGLKIFYNKNAVAFHFHQILVKDFLSRMEKVGESAYILLQKHPELKNIIAPGHLNFKQKCREIIDPAVYPIGLIFGFKIFIDRYYYTLLLKSYVKGYNKREKPISKITDRKNYEF